MKVRIVYCPSCRTKKYLECLAAGERNGGMAYELLCHGCGTVFILNVWIDIIKKNG